MEKINEKQLKELIYNMNKRTIEISIRGIITIEFVMHKVICKYNQRSGTISLFDKLTNKSIVIETMYTYALLNKDRRIIQVKLDNDEVVSIKIIN